MDPKEDYGGDTTITAIHPDIIKSHILNKLDGPTLTSTSCATTQFFSLCSNDLFWRVICNSTWPSTTDSRVREAISTFPSNHQSFYSDSFPSLRRHHHQFEITNQPPISDTTEFISAVDIFYDDKLIYSKVFVTEAMSWMFLTSAFQLDLLDSKENIPTGEACMSRAKERLRVSWILIDPVMKRAGNFASQKPVQARLRRNEAIELRYATVVAARGGEMVECGVLVTCDWKESGELRIVEVILQMEDMDGIIQTGINSLVILNDAMKGQRSKRDDKLEKDMYDEIFGKSKVENIVERKLEREIGLDVVACIAALCPFALQFGYSFEVSKYGIA